MPMKILLVEDDPQVSRMYQDLFTLSGNGYEVTLAADGEEGFNKISKGGFDLVLLDIMLPKMDGLEILRKVGEQASKTPNGPVILLTNLVQDTVIKEGLSLGATDYIIKNTMTPEQFLEKVKFFINKG